MVAAQAPRAQENSKVIVFSGRHAMLAELNSGQKRLSDVVNDPMHKHFLLEQVKINNADKMEENVAEYDRITIKREAIQAILVMSEPSRPPQQRISNFVPKNAVRIAVLLPSFHIEGSIFLNGKLDPADFVLDGTESFAVISNAQVTLSSRRGNPLAVPTALINRAHIEMATLL
jgi:hypothetical protein